MKSLHDRVVAFGASAGGVDALLKIAAALPADFPAPLLVVLHLSRDTPSMMPSLLSRAGALPAAQPRDGERLRPGRIYVAPPDHHMLLGRGHVHLRRGPRENNTRPAIDPLFRSAAVAYGPGAIGVVLTGNLYDGTAGLRSIKAHGGLAIVQDPSEAVFPSMPSSALRAVAVDHCLRLADIPGALVEVVGQPLPSPAAASNPESELDSDAVEVEIAEGRSDSYPLLQEIAMPSPYTCPECHGALWEIRDPGMLRFRCRVGHAFTADSLLALQDSDIENALWSAVRALEERAALSGRLADRIDLNRLSGMKERFLDRQEESQHHAEVLRKLLLAGIEKEAEE